MYFCIIIFYISITFFRNKMTSVFSFLLAYLVSPPPSALEHFKRWLIPEKVAISTEELEFLLRPSQKQEPAEADQMRSKEEPHDSNKDDALSPNRFKAEL